ncbi:hypothetical protein MPH_04069 [Macrophomina phaseolina MS6]|uniref:Uncharacterized protein n=1 Tax=Macrophomina phaseolina (strain MS6) TaxID=1126212 RepID=K2R8E9_MACPH|nr:hypothetical protein MPH_04069 [Macrophomina phaseolina MS6]
MYLRASTLRFRSRTTFHLASAFDLHSLPSNHYPTLPDQPFFKMKLAVTIISLLFTSFSSASLIKRDGGNTDCSPSQCLCEVILGRNAGDHEVITFLCEDNPDNKDCLKVCG